MLIPLQSQRGFESGAGGLGYLVSLQADVAGSVSGVSSATRKFYRRGSQEKIFSLGGRSFSCFQPHVMRAEF